MEKNSGGMTSCEPGRKNRYLLVVNGRLDDLNCTAMILQRFSYPVFTAQNGQQALDMISLVMPALMITDLVLPDMSGLDLLRKMGEKARFLQIILLLPEADATVEDRSVEIGGGIPCLTKPVSAEDLYRTIQSVIEATPRTNIRIPTALPVSVNKVMLNDARGECVTNLSEHGIRSTSQVEASQEAVGKQVAGRLFTAMALTSGTRRTPVRTIRDDHLRDAQAFHGN